MIRDCVAAGGGDISNSPRKRSRIFGGEVMQNATRGSLKPWFALIVTDTSGRTRELLLRCVLYSLLASGIDIVRQRRLRITSGQRFGPRAICNRGPHPVQNRRRSRPFRGLGTVVRGLLSREVSAPNKTRLEAALGFPTFAASAYKKGEWRLRDKVADALRDRTPTENERVVTGRLVHGCRHWTRSRRDETGSGGKRQGSA